MDLGLLGGIGEGLNRFADSYSRTRDKENQIRAEQEKLKYQQESDALDRRLKAHSQGVQMGDNGEMVYTPEHQQKMETDRLKTEAEIKELNSRAGYKKDKDPFERQVKLHEFKEEQEKRKRREQAKVRGFDVSEDITPSSKDAEEVKKQSAATEQIKATVKRIKDLVEKNQGTKIIPGESKDALSREYTNLKLQMKEAANLGALTGPDVALMEQMAPDPTSIYSTLKYDKEGLLKGYDDVSAAADRGLIAAAESRGYLRPKNKDPGGLINQDPQSGAVASPDLNSVKVINGVTYRKVQGGWEAVE